MKENITMLKETLEVVIYEQPIKGAEQSTVAIEQVRRQAELARDCLVTVNYYDTYGTCSDERRRIGLLSGSDVAEARPSIFGGPDIYGLAIAELTGMFAADDTSSTEDRLRTTKRRLNAGGKKSGGHVQCKANAGFADWMTIIAQQPNAIKGYAEQELGEAYNETAMEEVIDNATTTIESGRYADWDETVLIKVLGDEAAEAIEILADVPHEAYVVERNKIDGYTIDQTAVYDASIIGRGVFDVDDAYADAIEHIMTSGPDAVHKKTVAEHAREAIIAAIAHIVPNKELYEAIVK